MSITLTDICQLVLFHIHQVNTMNSHITSVMTSAPQTLLSSKFHGLFATHLEYVTSLICSSLGCIRLLNHIYIYIYIYIYVTLTTLCHLNIPLLLRNQNKMVKIFKKRRAG